MIKNCSGSKWLAEKFNKRFTSEVTVGTRLYYITCLLAVFFSICLVYVVFTAVTREIFKVLTIIFAVILSVSGICHFCGKYVYKYILALTVCLTFVVFPSIFLCTAGVQGGGLFIFIFGIFLLSVIVKKPLSYYLVFLLFAWYVCCIVLSIWYPHLVYFSDKITSPAAIAIIFFIVAVIMFLMLRTIVSGYNKEHRQLRILNDKLNYELITDDLTEIYNHRHIKNEIIRAVSEANENPCIYLLMYDIDDFKIVNDEYGHMIGNDILYDFAQMMKNEIGESGVCARYGGEEFVVLMKNKKADEVLAIAEKVRKRAEKELFVTNTNKIVTVSCGIAKYKPGENAEEFAKSVDDRMYKAKHQGKNQTVFY